MRTFTQTAAAHADAAGAASLPRIGALLWWALAESATSHEQLATAAVATGFPALWLPLPVSRDIAFSRALTRGTVHLPKEIGGKWRADAQQKTEDAAVALVQVWDPETNPSRPWRACFEACLARGDSSVVVLDEEAVKFFGVTTDEDAAVAARIRAAYLHERQHATAAEIRVAATSALEEVGGLRVRPGLWFVPDETGAERTAAVAAWVRSAGGSDAGSVDLFDVPSHKAEGSRYAEQGLQAAVVDLVADVEAAVGKDGGVGALRSQWEAIEQLERRLKANATLLAAASETLRGPLDEARRLLSHEAAARDVDLERTTHKKAVVYLQEALLTLRAAAESRDAAGLLDASEAIRRAQPAALAGHFGPVWRRMRDLVEVAAKERSEGLFAGVGSAVLAVANRATVEYGLDFSDIGG